VEEMQKNFSGLSGLGSAEEVENVLNTYA